MATISCIPLKPEKLLKPFFKLRSSRISVFRDPQLHFLQRRNFTSYSKNFRPLNMGYRGTLLLAVGSVVSLGCVGILRQTRTEVSCENDTTSKVESRGFKNTGSEAHPKAKLQNISSLKPAINEAHIYLQQVREEIGVPGLVVAVSVDGKLVWSEGMGYADVENHVKCTPDTVMRIASISKPLTVVAVAKLHEEKKLDIDAPVQQYVPAFPQKHFNGKPVTITTRQLVSHLGGIRHYHETGSPKEEPDKLKERSKEKDEDSASKAENSQEKSKNTAEQEKSKKTSNLKETENYIKEPKTMKESLAIFQDDPLIVEPGESFFYTSYGYTLISAVVESVAQEDFLSYMKKVFRDLEMNSTGPEMNDKITYNRSRYYQRGKRNGLVNTPYVDNSYKWAGGGFVSTVEDLVKFGNAMLYAYQVKDYKGNELLPGILQPETMHELWKKVDKNEGKAHKDGWYGWGWFVLPDKQTYGACRHQKQTIFHTGGAVGAVSILLLRPDNRVADPPTLPPQGIVVSIIMNLQEISKSLQTTAEHVADIFEKNLHASPCGTRSDA